MVLSDKAQATRDRILNAATELFHLHGYNATGLDKVIKAAGVTKGNFYYHFASKEVLALTTLDWQFELIQKDMNDKVFNKNASPLTTLVNMLELMVEKQKEQHGNGCVCGCYFGNFTVELSTASSEIRDKVKNIFNQYIQVIESLLTKARDRGEIPQHINPVEFSPIILGQIEGAIMLDKAQQEPKNAEASIKYIKRFLSV